MKETISGIYRIQNKVNGKLYIGSTKDFIYRWKMHKSGLNNNRHKNKHLQNAWKKYGKENFEFEIIEYCLKEELIKKEQYYIDFYKSNNIQLYNIRDKAESNLGIKFSNETKNKIRNKLKGRNNWWIKGKKLTEEHKNKIRNSMKGKNKGNSLNSGVFKVGRIPWNIGKRGQQHHSDETKLKMSKSRKGNKNMLGKHHSDETKLKMSKSRKGKRRKKGIKEVFKMLKENYSYREIENKLKISKGTISKWKYNYPELFKEIIN